jgi:hypothetical protein
MNCLADSKMNKFQNFISFLSLFCFALIVLIPRKSRTLTSVESHKSDKVMNNYSFPKYFDSQLKAI